MGTSPPQPGLVTAGKVLRYFYIDIDAFDEIADAVTDALMEEDNAVEAGSGHTGFLVALEDDPRTDDEIIASLTKRLPG